MFVIKNWDISICQSLGKIEMRERLRKILYWILPELRLLREKDSDLSVLKSHKDYVDDCNHVVMYAPYSFSESSIGKCSYIAHNSHVSNASIGRFCSIGPNFLCGWGIHPITGISTSPMFYSTRKQNGFTLSETNKIEERKKIIIGNDVFIGANVVVLDGVTIGDGAVIGAGTVVSKDIPPYAVAVGSPIRIIKYRFESEQIEALRKLEWWNYDDEELNEVERFFFDIDGFIQYQNAKCEQ